MAAAFPFLFILDEALALPLSPVLPGLLLFALLIIGLPLVIAEVWARRLAKRKDADVRLLRATQTSWTLLGVAFIWFVLWLSLGV